MIKRFISNRDLTFPSLIRKFLGSWLVAVTIEYSLLPAFLKPLQELDGLAEASLFRLLALLVICFLLLVLLNQQSFERWLIPISYAVLSTVSLIHSFTFPFLFVNCIVLAIMIIYAVKGWDIESRRRPAPVRKKRCWAWITTALTIGFFLFVSAWTVCRVKSFSTPTYDFGIFSQMFHSMRTTGLPMTTLERDGLLSHFQVHVSPIYYLLLPLYCLYPKPEMLQILQAMVLASATIPLWLIGKHHGLNPLLRACVCVMLLLYPAYSGGASYDIHENAFLTPLILWLFYSTDKKHIPLSAVFSVLILSVKEDAAVYVAVIAIYDLLCGSLRRDKSLIYLGFSLLCVSILWFISVTGYLSHYGDGVMTYRYQNFMYNDSDTLISVIIATIKNPMKAVFECVDSEKLTFIGLTLLPLAGLPLCTRKYERYVLVIPYVLINLMSDYQYQHSIFFQYTFGSTACLFYLTILNIADFKSEYKKYVSIAICIIISVACFITQVLPKANYYIQRYQTNSASFQETEDLLSLIPENATVSATTFYTTYLSQRPIIYDIRYGSWENILSTEYVVLSVSDQRFEETELLLNANGYTQFASLDGTLVIYRKSQ